MLLHRAAPNIGRTPHLGRTAPPRRVRRHAARRRPVTHAPTGCAQTVLGPVEPAALGVVMPHEHLFVDLTCMFDPPTEASDRSRAYAPFSLEQLGWIRTHYFRHLRTSTLDDEERRRLRGRPLQGGRRLDDRRRLHAGYRPRPARARAALAGDGRPRRHGDRLLRRLDAPARGRRDERGRRHPAAGRRDRGGRRPRPAPSRRPGLGSGRPSARGSGPGSSRRRRPTRSTPRSGRCSERRPRASARPARGSRCTSAATRTRRSRSSTSLREAGADLDRCSLDHLDLRVERTETLLGIAETGCFLEFDLFGHESSYYPLTAPRHAERRPAARRRRRPRRPRAHAAAPRLAGHLHAAPARPLRRARLQARRRARRHADARARAGPRSDIDDDPRRQPRPPADLRREPQLSGFASASAAPRSPAARRRRCARRDPARAERR